jgi:polygalacturonase
MPSRFLRLFGLLVAAGLLGTVARAQTSPVAPTGGSAHHFDVRAFGATGDGQTLDTESINRAIEAAGAAGGGTVYFPAGTYLSFSIRLKSNIALYLDQGATLLAASPAEGVGHYDLPEPNEWSEKYQYQDFGHSHWHNSLIWGENLENISILGPGRIDGRKGLTRFGGGVRGPGRNEGLGPMPPRPEGAPRPSGSEGGPRPPGSSLNMAGLGNKAIGLKLCRNVVIRDISILQSGHFALLVTGVDNLTLDNLKVDASRDGFDIDACRNVRISNCSVNAPHDDAIVLKSSFALGFARACENITIVNCQVTGYDMGTFLDGTFQRTMERAPDRDGPTGRIKCGTESNGGFKNIAISNCVFDRSRGLALETVDGGSIEDITISNIVMRDVSNSPLFLRLGNRARGPEGTPVAVMRRITISNVVAYDVDPRYASIIAGVPGHPVEDVHLSDIRIVYKGGLDLEQVAKQPPELANTFFQRGAGAAPAGPRDPFDVPERETGYPEPSMFGLLPAYGLYVRHVQNLSVRNVEVSYLKEDKRPPVVLDDVAGVSFDSVKAQSAADTPFFVLRQVSDFVAHNCPGLPDTRREQVDSEQL